MAKYRHNVGGEVSLTGFGVVGPFQVIETSLDLSTTPNFDLVVDEPTPEPEPVAEEPVVPVKSKKNPEPVEAPPADAPSEG